MRPLLPQVVIASGSFEVAGVWREAIEREWSVPRYASERRDVLREIDQGADLLIIFPVADSAPTTLAAEVRRHRPSCAVIGVAPRDADSYSGCNDIVEHGSSPQVLIERARRCLARPPGETGDGEALEAIPVAAALLDAAGGFAFANQALRELIELPDGTAIDRFHARAFFRDLAGWERLRSTSRQARCTQLLSVQTLTGRLCRLEVTAGPWREGTTVVLRELAAGDQQVRELAEALSRSEERYRAIVEDQSDMVTRSLPDGTLTYVNPATCRILGAPADHLIGRNWHDFVAGKEALELAVERLDSLGAHRASVVNDSPVRTASGETRWYAWENRAIFDRQGRVSEISAVGRDVTERRRAEQALRESQATLQSFYDGTPLFMGVSEVSDGKIRLVHANAAAAQFFGKTPEELTYYDPETLGTTPEIQALWLRQFERSRREGHSVRFEYVRVGRDREHWLKATATFLGGDERPRFSFVVQDETARRDAEVALRESEGRLATVFREAPVGITVSRLGDGRFVDVNPAFCALFGYARDEILGNTATGLGITPDAGYRKPMLEELATAETVRGREARLRARSGEWRDCLTSFGRITLGGQECVLTILQDVTDGRRTAEKLERALGEREVLLREIHHRVKNNLQLLSSLMSFELSRGRGQEVHQVAESLGRRIHAMAVVHEHLYGAHDLSSLPADAYLRDLLRANLAAHGDATARLTVSVEIAPMALSLDVALRLGLIVSELTSNTLRHALGHGREGTLLLRLDRYGDGGFELVVRDDGVGIGASAESQPATMGLRLVRQLARQLSGDISCTSGPGTTWTLRVAHIQ
jgi:two-component system, sensor histidine kinase PdtaS